MEVALCSLDLHDFRATIIQASSVAAFAAAAAPSGSIRC